MTELKKKSVEDLTKALVEKREELRSFRFDLAGSAKKNVKAAANTRKEVARMLTELKARQEVTA